MHFIVDPANPVPMYRQLVDQVIYRIASGELTDGDQLPSIRTLSTELRINPNTVIKSYRELEHEGFAVSRHGRGYFIAGVGLEPARANWRERAVDVLRTSADRAISVGVSPEAIRAVIENAIEEGGGK